MRTLLPPALLCLILTGCYSDSETDPANTDSGTDTIPDEVSTDVAQGALIYEDWTSTAAGGTGVLPSGESTKAYVQCVSCHGWDQLGENGGFARRERTAERPNAGYGDRLNTAVRNISTGQFGALTAVTTGQIVGSGGRAWSEGSGSWDGSPEGYAKGNEHPDYSQDGGLPQSQIDYLVAFLNAEEVRADRVFASIDATADPVRYTLISTADAARGESFYQTHCVACHGAPDADSGTTTNNLPGTGGFVAFLQTDGAPSKFMHRMRWGAPGTTMTRAAIGSPGAPDVADVLAYIQNYDGSDNSGPIGDVTAGQAIWDNTCSNCHNINYPPPPEPVTNDMSTVDLNMQGVTLTDQEVADIKAFLSTL